MGRASGLGNVWVKFRINTYGKTVEGNKEGFSIHSKVKRNVYDMYAISDRNVI